MMKKLLLLLSVGVVVNGAYAQKAANTSIMVSSVPEQQKALTDKTATLEDVKKATPWRYNNNSGRSANKGTISGTRTYNYVDYLDLLGTPDGSFPLMWEDGDGMVIYTPSAGVNEYDTTAFMSYGSVLHPWIAGFNDQFVPDYAGKVGIRSYSAYRVDTIAYYGLYQRNSQKHGITDTLRVSLIWSNATGSTSSSDIWIASWFTQTPGVFLQRYGSDTLRVPTVRYDSVRRVARGTTRIVKDILLDNSNANDTLSNGVHRFKAYFGQNIPAGNLVATTATFISGDPNKPAPYTDTVFTGPLGAEPAKFNLFRPWVFEQADGQYPKYEAGNYNTGMGMLRQYDTGSSFYDTYIAAYFWNEQGGIEFPYVDWIIHCADCPAVGVNDVQGLISNVKVYPNPAVNEVRVPFALGAASDVQVSFTNVMGQIISSQSFTNVTTGEAVFTTNHLPNGVYLINVEAGGENKVQRVSVTH